MHCFCVSQEAMCDVAIGWLDIMRHSTAVYCCYCSAVLTRIHSLSFSVIVYVDN